MLQTYAYPAQRVVTTLGYWPMGQGKYSSSLLRSVESHFFFHANTSTDQVKFSAITVYTFFFFFFLYLSVQCQNFLLHEIKVLKAVPIYLYESQRNEKTQHIPEHFMPLFCVQRSCSESGK